MKKFRAAVVGYGNIGKFTVEALEAAPDFEIAGIVRRQGAKDKPAEPLANYEVVDDITKLKDVDVAILATPTRSCPEVCREDRCPRYQHRRQLRYPHQHPRLPYQADGKLQEGWQGKRYLCWLGPRF